MGYQCVNYYGRGIYLARSSCNEFLDRSCSGACDGSFKYTDKTLDYYPHTPDYNFYSRFIPSCD